MECDSMRQRALRMSIGLGACAGGLLLLVCLHAGRQSDGPVVAGTGRAAGAAGGAEAAWIQSPVDHFILARLGSSRLAAGGARFAGTG